MKQFTPCKGKQFCRDDGNRCLSCGRQLDEIVWLRDLIDQLASLANEYNYDNLEEYAAYINTKVIKTIRYRREQLGAGNE